MSWTIALVQMDCVAGDVAANLQRLARAGRVLATLGADEGIALATIDVASSDFVRWSEVATYVHDRRPELYARSIGRG